MNSAPDIKPIRQKTFDVPASRYKQCAGLPLRSIILAPSGGGKGILLQNFILDIYRGCFERIYIFSPSIHVDSNWAPVKKYLQEGRKNKTADELFFDEYDPSALQEIVDTQKKVVEHQKDNGHKKLFQILIVVDDFADDPAFSRHSKLLHSLFTRGRHNQISTIVATQKYNAVSPIVRVNATELYVFRLRSSQDLNTVIEENSALVDKATLMEVSRLATAEPFSFLFINLQENAGPDVYVPFLEALPLRRVRW